MALDSWQQAAVMHNRGPAMILAGPGSGKTTVITHRLVNLTEELKINPKKILVITFTKMAAVQMKERYLKLCNSNTTEITFGTFHAVFFMILKCVCGYKATDIIRTSEQRALVKMHLMARGISVQDENTFVHDVMSEIGKVKGSFTDVTGYISSSCEQELFKELYNCYEELLRGQRKVDFEDMMVSTLKILREREDVLKTWQDLYDYILVDEFQDAAPVQFEIVKLLGEKHNNIFVVGDDDQSIYGFRGAAPDVMKAFEREYEDVKIYNLDVNYRCTGHIVKSATAVINKNTNRFYKNLRAFNSDGDKVKLMRSKDIEQESACLVQVVEQLLEKTDYSIAILTRTHTGAKELAGRLESKGVRIRGGKKKSSVFQHWIALDIASYIRIATACGNRADYLRVINKPMRYIDRMYFAKEDISVETIMESIIKVGQKELLDEFKRFVEDMQCVGNMSPFAGFNYILKKVGYEAYIKEYAKDTGIAWDVLADTVNKLSDSIKACYSYSEWLKHMEQDGTDRKYDNCNDRVSSQEERVVFNTMHGSKGLEFDVVIIPDVNEGIIPYSKAVTKESLEEERRLFYVAMTRAKKQLIISYTDMRYNKYVQPSRYIRELHHSKSCV